MLKNNMELIEEVVDSINNMKLYSKKCFELEDIIEINDFEEAQFYAFENLEYEIESEQGYSWIDLRELVMSKVHGDGYKIQNYREFNKIIVDKFKPMIRERVKIMNEYSDTINDVCADLGNCIQCRGVYGKNDSLFEKMYSAYKSGGWPCGWNGNYPEGKLIVFYPNS
jgi:hypothetical protein